MTRMQISILNHLLRMPKARFGTNEQDFLVLLSTKLRYILITRQEGMALSKIGNLYGVLTRDSILDPGIPRDWEGTKIEPEPETDHAGGPGGTRPDGTGTGLDPVPDDP